VSSKGLLSLPQLPANCSAPWGRGQALTGGAEPERRCRVGRVRGHIRTVPVDAAPPDECACKDSGPPRFRRGTWRCSRARPLAPRRSSHSSIAIGRLIPIAGTCALHGGVRDDLRPGLYADRALVGGGRRTIAFRPAHTGPDEKVIAPAAARTLPDNSMCQMTIAEAGCAGQQIAWNSTGGFRICAAGRRRNPGESNGA
jgi:hypothetical protein